VDVGKFHVGDVHTVSFLVCRYGGEFCDIAPIQDHSFKKRIQQLEKSRRCIILKLDFESAEVFYVYQTFS
jgi:hypothetical protein